MEHWLFFLDIHVPSLYIKIQKHGVSGPDGFAAPGCGDAVHSFLFFLLGGISISFFGNTVDNFTE